MEQKSVIQTGKTITITDAYDTVYVPASFLRDGGTLNATNASHVVIVNDLGSYPAYLQSGQININGNAYIESQVIMAGKNVSVNFSGTSSILQVAPGQFTSGLTAYPTFSGFNSTSKLMMADLPAGTYRIGLSVPFPGSNANRLNFYSNLLPGSILSVPFGTTIPSNYASPPHGEPNGTASFSQTQCFLAGTMIDTVAGCIAVEHLRVGNRVRVFGDQLDTARMVIWAGRKTVSSAENGYPVRIRKDAFGPNTPSSDLLITGEHCLCIENALIPARMLVNGVSIVLDTDMSSYEVFHVELTQHSIIHANDLLCESYLDTGTRQSFTRLSESDDIVSLCVSGQKSWEGDSALPLRTERSFVEPIYHALCKRAQEIGMETGRSTFPTTTEADIHLVTNCGESLTAERISGMHHIFRLPPNIAYVDLVTRTGKPSDMIGPYVDDRRELGILVGQITHFCADETYQLCEHLTVEALTGWNTIENSQTRWTAGSARITLENNNLSSSSTLSVEIVATGFYPADTKVILLDSLAAA